MNSIQPTTDSDPSAEQPDIVSVNSRGSKTQGNRSAKVIFVMLSVALLIGLLVWVSQSWLSARKDSLKASSSKPGTEAPDLLNPEKTGVYKKVKLGADGDTPPAPPPLGPASAVNGIRPMRGPDGKIILNAQGKALGVDQNGNIVEVPAITAIVDDPAGKKPLPGQVVPSAGANSNNGQQRPPSRFGGALFVEGTNPTPVPAAGAAFPAQSNADVLKGLLGGAATATPPPVDFAGNSNNTARAGSVGSQIASGATPVAVAKKSFDQNLYIPKGRQADCVLTGRIIDETPGYTSCTLTQNMYSANGRVLLLERGSDLIGEYGTSSQLGVRRLFVTWSRVRTPSGVEVELASPGADSLGTSGLPGQLDNRWMERIGTAFLLSFIKDVAAAVIANQNKPSSSTGNSVNIQQAQPGSNTSQAGFTIADEVVRQTIKVRPTLTINEGDRISIYVARDLDFSGVYSLRAADIKTTKAE